MATCTLEMREKRNDKIEEARRILDKAERETRRLTVEERTQYDALFKEARSLKTEIDGRIDAPCLPWLTFLDSVDILAVGSNEIQHASPNTAQILFAPFFNPGETDLLIAAVT